MPGKLIAGRERTLAAALTLAVTAVRLYFLRRITFCGTPDSCHALAIAQSLDTRHGFFARTFFDLQLKTHSLPNTGIEYWRPGASFFLLLAKPFGGVTLFSSLVVATLAGIVLALAAWRIAMQASGNRRLALASYALCLVLPTLWSGDLSPDTALFYGAAVAWFLALFTVRRQGLLQDVLALVCVGVTYLIRNDAGLLLLPLLAVLWRRRMRAAEAGTAVPGSSTAYAAAMIAGFALALAPMHLIYRHTLGVAFPSGAGQALYFNDLSDMSSYGAPVSLHTLLAHGAKHLLAVRVATAAFTVYRVAVLMIGYPALVFLLAWAGLGAAREANADSGKNFRASLPELTGPVVFAVVTLAVYSFVLPAVGIFSALRTSVGLLPLAAVLTVLAVLRVAATPRVAAVLVAALIGVYGLGGLMDDRRAVQPVNEAGDALRTTGRALEAMGAQPGGPAVVMTVDPVQFAETTGFAAVTLPGNGVDAVVQAAHDLHATHLVLDGLHPLADPEALRVRLAPVQVRELPGSHTVLMELGAK